MDWDKVVIDVEDDPVFLPPIPEELVKDTNGEAA